VVPRRETRAFKPARGFFSPRGAAESTARSSELPAGAPASPRAVAAAPLPVAAASTRAAGALAAGAAADAPAARTPLLARIAPQSAPLRARRRCRRPRVSRELMQEG